MKAVAYLRVSQEDENIENQLIVIRKFCARKGIELVGVFKDEDVSGTIKPREREGYKSMLKFCKDNNINTIVFFDLSRLSRNVLHGLEELKNLTDEGYNVYFAGMDFLNYDLDPIMKKKIILDFLWFAEMYVEDVRRRTKIAMQRLKSEGKVYTRPRLSHYIALWLCGKEKFSDLSKEDIEKAEEYLYTYIKERKALDMSLREIHECFVNEHIFLYKKMKAPRSYIAFWREWKRLVEKYRSKK